MEVCWPPDDGPSPVGPAEEICHDSQVRSTQGLGECGEGGENAFHSGREEAWGQAAGEQDMGPGSALVQNSDPSSGQPREAL